MTSAVGIPVTSRKLGKLPPRHDPRTLLMASYLVPHRLPAIPPAKSWLDKVSDAPPNGLGQMLNDQLGDCTCAAMAHQIQIWTANEGRAGSEVTLTDSDVLAAYEGACGYNPADPSTDGGGVEIDVLNYWRTTGIGGHRIAAYVALEPKSLLQVKAAIALFGGAYIGISLPATAQGQAVWSVVPNAPTDQAAPGSWGGHAVCCVAYDEHFVTCITWGEPLRMTWAFFVQYCEEAYVCLSNDWCANGTAPSGFDLAALQADLAAL